MLCRRAAKRTPKLNLSLVPGAGHAEFNPPQILDRLLVAHASSTKTIIQAAHRLPPPTTKIRNVKIKTA